MTMNVSYYNGWVDFDGGELFIKLDNITSIEITKGSSKFFFEVKHSQELYRWKYDTREEAERALGDFKVATDLIDTRTIEEIKANQELEESMFDDPRERLSQASNIVIGEERE